MPTKTKTFAVGNVGTTQQNVRRLLKKLSWHLIVSNFMSRIK